MIADLIQMKGKMFADESEDLSSEKIVEIIETLNPKFNDGEQILVYNEEKKQFSILDYGDYEQALADIHLNRGVKNENL